MLILAIVGTCYLKLNGSSKTVSGQLWKYNFTRAQLIMIVKLTEYEMSLKY